MFEQKYNEVNKIYKMNKSEVEFARRERNDIIAERFYLLAELKKFSVINIVYAIELQL
jgi:hypothetical protein